MKIEEKIRSMGLDLGDAPVPQANYVPAVRVGDLLFLSGHLPRQRDGSMLNPGKVEGEVSIQQGYAAARQTAVNCLATVKAIVGDLSKVKKVVKLTVLVNSDPEFDRHFLVANGASDLLVELYGDAGRHARTTVGVAALPLRSSVEIEMVVQVGD